MDRYAALCHINSRKFDMSRDHVLVCIRGLEASHFIPLLIHKKKENFLLPALYFFDRWNPMKISASYHLQAETDNPHYFTLDWIVRVGKLASAVGTTLRSLAYGE